MPEKERSEEIARRDVPKTSKRELHLFGKLALKSQRANKMRILFNNIKTVNQVNKRGPDRLDSTTEPLRTTPDGIVYF